METIDWDSQAPYFAGTSTKFFNVPLNGGQFREAPYDSSACRDFAINVLREKDPNGVWVADLTAETTGGLPTTVVEIDRLAAFAASARHLPDLDSKVELATILRLTEPEIEQAMGLDPGIDVDAHIRLKAPAKYAAWKAAQSGAL